MPSSSPPGRAGRDGVVPTSDLSLPGPPLHDRSAPSGPELLAHYRGADVFVSLSEHEGFLVPALEAMYFGVPLVPVHLRADVMHGQLAGAPGGADVQITAATVNAGYDVPCVSDWGSIPFPDPLQHCLRRVDEELPGARAAFTTRSNRVRRRNGLIFILTVRSSS